MKLLLLILLLSLSPVASRAQASGQGSRDEQSSFGTEEVPGRPRVMRPLPVPSAVLQILETDEMVKSCLEDNPLPPGRRLGSWFVASEVHLDGPAETDFVVVPSFQGEERMCFQSVAGIGWFWIFRKVETQYRLVLKAAGNGLSVLETRSNGYRDIQTSTLGQAGKYLTTLSFRFDGERYTKLGDATQQR